MIFSKDKKPSEPGFYWAKDSDGITVVEVYLDRDRLMVTVLGWDSDIKIDWISEWGDRIETPVETFKEETVVTQS